MKQYRKMFLAVMMFLLFGCAILKPSMNASAADAAVAIKAVDYEMLTLTLTKNGNNIIYYSTNNSTWNELEAKALTGDSLVMDISWVSATADTTLYFKGDSVETVVKITLPKKNNTIKVTFDKAEGNLSFDNTDAATSFEWRKSTDYNWMSVSFDETSASYESFLAQIEALRVKGSKIIVRTAQTAGTATNPGTRPSKEVTVTISARPNAPKVQLNTTKLTFSTTASMEYYDAKKNMWLDCTKTMTVEELAPAAINAGGKASAVTLMFRTAGSDSKPYSKTQTLIVPAQGNAPTIGDSSSDVAWYIKNNKNVVLTFKNATKTNVYEYAVVKQGADETKLSWRSVMSSKEVSLSVTSAPDGSTIYVRKKGTNESVTKKLSLSLPSAINSFSVKITTGTETTK